MQDVRLDHPGRKPSAGMGRPLRGCRADKRISGRLRNSAQIGRFGGSVGNAAKNTVAAESLQNTGADIEKAAVKLKRPGADRARDPWESHQIFE